jgi:hypothetical protein
MNVRRTMLFLGISFNVLPAMRRYSGFIRGLRSYFIIHVYRITGVLTFSIGILNSSSGVLENRKHDISETGSVLILR